MNFNSSSKKVITVFVLGTFALGMTGNVVTGLLSQLSNEFDVTISTSGLLLSMYAVGVAFFGPILRLGTINYPPKLLLISLMSVFILSNVIAATAGSFEVLMFSRLLSSSMHAPFFGLCMMIAFNIAGSKKGTNAMARVQSGLSLAIMIGVPLGTLIGGVLDWRIVFWIMASLGVLTLLGIVFTTPNIRPAQLPDLKTELKVLKNKNVLMIIAVILFGFSGVFITYAYVEPMLREFGNFGLIEVSIGLFCFGLGGVMGNMVCGRIHPNRLTQWLLASFVFLSIVLSTFTLLLHIPVMGFLMCFLLGAGTFGTTPIFNSKIVMAATEAPLLSGTIAASAFNLSSFIGSSLGSMLLQNGFSYEWLTLISGGFMIIGIGLTIFTHHREDKTLFRNHAENVVS
ncbi:MFS transporter [Halobacillus litoralis]|uniref:MFS transporter n=1 Tax=Halobacillus litoralis TaxID=45668 RepID=UPI001CFCA562|nr:MFS transporter [Halobacillus litoralis]WLR46636.1 MFS transporter [Halobacillus litoralis]